MDESFRAVPVAGRDAKSAGFVLMEHGDGEPGMTKLESRRHQRWLGAGVAACVFHLISDIISLIVCSIFLYYSLNAGRCDLCVIGTVIYGTALSVSCLDLLIIVLTLVALRRNWLCPKILAAVWHCLLLAGPCMLFVSRGYLYIIIGLGTIALLIGQVVIFSVLSAYHRKGGRW